METTIIEGQDFGVPVKGLRPGKQDLWETPVEAIVNRPTPAPSVKGVSVALAEKQANGSALKAVQDEVNGGDVVFTYDGETYHIPRVEDWDIEIFEAQESGKLITTAKLLFGDDQFAKFKTKAAPTDSDPNHRVAVKRKASDLDGLISAGMAAMGVKPGE